MPNHDPTPVQGRKIESVPQFKAVRERDNLTQSLAVPLLEDCQRVSKNPNQYFNDPKVMTCAQKRDFSKTNNLLLKEYDQTAENSKVKEVLSSRQGWLSVSSN